MIRELHEEETALAYAAMAELRTHLVRDQDAFIVQVNEVQRPQSYRLFAAFDPEDREAAAVAGFRRLSSLAWGDVLYIDDLSTRAASRRRGHGRSLLAAVEREARELGCVAVHLEVTTGSTPTGCTSARATRSGPTTSSSQSRGCRTRPPFPGRGIGPTPRRGARR